MSVLTDGESVPYDADESTGLDVLPVGGDEVNMEELEELRRAAYEACMADVEQHLGEFLTRRPGASYEEWIAELHPENARTTAAGGATIDSRFYVEESDHLQLWRSFAGGSLPVPTLQAKPLPITTVVGSVEARDCSPAPLGSGKADGTFALAPVATSSWTPVPLPVDELSRSRLQLPPNWRDPSARSHTYTPPPGSAYSYVPVASASYVPMPRQLPNFNSPMLGRGVSSYVPAPALASSSQLLVRAMLQAVPQAVPRATAQAAPQAMPQAVPRAVPQAPPQAVARADLQARHPAVQRVLSYQPVPRPRAEQNFSQLAPPQRALPQRRILQQRARSPVVSPSLDLAARPRAQPLPWPQLAQAFPFQAFHWRHQHGVRPDLLGRSYRGI